MMFFRLQGLLVEEEESCLKNTTTFFRYAFLISSLLPTSDIDKSEAPIHSYSHLHSRRVRLQEVHKVSIQLTLTKIVSSGF